MDRVRESQANRMKKTAGGLWRAGSLRLTTPINRITHDRQSIFSQMNADLMSPSSSGPGFHPKTVLHGFNQFEIRMGEITA
jgi:hypothetical protein